MLFSRANKAKVKQGEQQEQLVAIDIGSSSVRLVAGQVDNEGRIFVECSYEEQSKGMLSGAVTDLSELSGVLAEVVKAYEGDDHIFSHCIIGIAGRHIASKNELGRINVISHKVTEEDVEQALIDVSSIKFSEYSLLIHVLPQNYETDDTAEVSNPVGLSASRLGVNAHLIACNEDQENNLRTAVERMSPNIMVDQVIFNGLAASEAVLNAYEKDIGVCLINLGEGTTDVCIYNDGNMIVSFGLAQGADGLIKKIAKSFGVSTEIAKALLIKVGVAHSKFLQEGTENKVCTIKDSNNTVVPFKALANVINDYLVDIFYQIRDKVNAALRAKDSNIELGSGYVLTGGLANLNSIASLAAFLLKNDNVLEPVKVRIGRPIGVDENGAELVNPSWATALGLLRFGHSVQQEDFKRRKKVSERKQNNTGIRKLIHDISDWFSREF